MKKLSVVIITLNEEKNIGRCIDSVKDIADDIVVVDSFSTDKTKDICLEKGVSLYEKEWLGYSGQKNCANTLAKFDYILSLDADEALSDDLIESIQSIKEHWTCDAWEMNRLTNYCGTWIKHCGWYPDRKLRLFDRRKAMWDNVEIHEKIHCKKDVKTGFLKGNILHYSYYSIEGHIAQINKFSSIMARELHHQGKKAGLLKVISSPVVRFIRDYILKLGVLDGYYGFLICTFSAYATFLKNVKLRQLGKGKEV